MLHIYSRDRYLATIEPLPYAKLAKYKVLIIHLLERIEQYGFEIGEFIAHEGDRLLRDILALHQASFSLHEIATDYELIQHLFTKDLIELNKFVPCAEGQKDRPHLNADSPYKNLKIKKSGDRYIDDLADLATMLGSYEQAVALTNELTQTQIDSFAFRYGERNRSPDDLINEQNKEYFAQWMNDDFGKDYMRQALAT
jgi:hypothetical protein